MRQLLADKVTGNLAGLWLLVPELLRLGAWDLVCGWTKKRPEYVEPRLALQLINEAALCITGLRLRRGLNQQIFELVNGLSFLASDMAVHELLGARTVADEEGKAVSQFEDLLVQAAAQPHARDAKRRLVDQLQSQTRFDAFRASGGPAAYQVPGSQAEKFGDEQPQPGQVSHDLVGEQLPHASLDAFRVARYGLGAFLGDLCFDGGLSIRSVAIEFFFEGRTPR